MKKISGRFLFIVAYFAYSSIYIARLNLTVASPVMQEQQLMSASQIGLMGSVFFMLYSIGQLLNGYLGDIIPARKMVMTGLLLTAAANIGIGVLSSAAGGNALLSVSSGIILLWGVNGFAQSMLWGPLLRSVSSQFAPERKSFIGSLLVSSVGFGSILGIFLATLAIQYSSLRFAFLIPAGIALTALIVVFFLFHPEQNTSAVRSSGSIRGIFTPSFVCILLAAMFHGVLKDNINLWMADYFVDTFQVNLVTMSFYVFLIPVLTLVGRLLYPLVYQLFGKREHLTSIFAFGVMAVSLIPLCLPGVHPALAAAGLSLAACAVSVANTSFLTIYPMRYQESGHVSKVAGMMDFATYMGAGISSSLYGVWLEDHSYSGMFLSWIVLAVLGIGLLGWVMRRKNANYNKG